MTLKRYLNNKYTATTTKSYEREINIFLAAVPQAQEAIYQDIINYINTQRKDKKPSSLHRILQSIKKYYNYLVYKEIRQDNPAQFILLKDFKNKQVLIQQRILEPSEIQALWQYFLTKEYRYKLLKNRNLCLVGLLLFQALRVGEIMRLDIKNIDLQNSQIFIEKSHNTAARTLSLEPCQILPLYHYLYQDRAVLLKEKKDTNTVFISKLGAAEKGETLHYLIETARHLFEDKTLNPKTLRMSVISQQFKQGQTLQQVQYFAGHRYPSSTERYKTGDLEALQQSVLRHHPLQ